MQNNSLIKRTLILLVALIFFTIIMMVLVGPNSIINQEKEKYDQTHVEEKSEKANKGNIVIVENQ